MKTSDLGAYQHLETVTPNSNTVVNYKGLYCASGVAITGTTWEKDSSGNWKNYSITTQIGGVLPFSPRTIATASGTVYGLR